MPDVAEIAGRLSEAQRRALTHKNAGGCSYTWAGIGTLQALHSRGLVLRNGRRGSMFSPQTNIRWPLTPLGLAVRAYLENSREAMPRSS